MEAQAELLRLVKNLHQWVRDNLESSQPEQAHTVRLLLIDLHNIATNHPEQAQAALIGAKTMWHMLRDDAWTGFGVRHGRKPLSSRPGAATIEKAMDQYYRENPDVKNITELRKKVCTRLSIGRSTLLGKTKYDPLKKIIRSSTSRWTESLLLTAPMARHMPVTTTTMEATCTNSQRLRRCSCSTASRPPNSSA
jgi:hypothetical protein